MQLPTLPKISKGSLKTLTDIFTDSSKVALSKTRRVSPHIKTVAFAVVENVAKKAEYAPDIFQMVYINKLSMTKVAEILGISPSYGYKLLNKELLKRGLLKR